MSGAWDLFVSDLTDSSFEAFRKRLNEFIAVLGRSLPDTLAASAE